MISDPAGGIYDENTVVTLTATPASGFEFSGWSGDLSGELNPAVVIMDADKNVTATFIELPPQEYSLTANVDGSGSISMFITSTIGTF